MGSLPDRAPRARRRRDPALAAELDAESVFANHDYEPQAIARDHAVQQRLREAGRSLQTFKDQVIFEKDEVLTQAGGAFSVFTPYKNAWLKRLALHPDALDALETAPWAGALAPPRLGDDACRRWKNSASSPTWPEDLPPACPARRSCWTLSCRASTATTRARLPGARQHLAAVGAPALRHAVDPRPGAHCCAMARGPAKAPRTWLSELIWREFYMMILQRHPRVVTQSFKAGVRQAAVGRRRRGGRAFAAWCEGRTGYPLVDAAMAQLNRTGFMHNRLRMVTASFLTKDLGISWRAASAISRSS
jgi:deoxyribodipyrimidine photo-lyase